MTGIFKPGDKIKATDIVGGGVLTGWIAPNPEEDGKHIFVNYVDPHPVQGVFDFEGMLGDENINVELVATLADQIPSVPGVYIDVAAKAAYEFLLGLGLDDGEGDEDLIWTLNEDGSWTDSEGESGTDTWLFPVMGIVLEPVQ